MDYSEITDKVCGIVADIFECDPRALSGETRLMTDLPCESIDLLEIGARLGREYGVEYLVSDFKKKNGYKRSVELSEEYGLYRQDYCGCEISLAERRRSQSQA